MLFLWELVPFQLWTRVLLSWKLITVDYIYTVCYHKWLCDIWPFCHRGREMILLSCRIWVFVIYFSQRSRLFILWLSMVNLTKYFPMKMACTSFIFWYLFVRSLIRKMRIAWDSPAKLFGLVSGFNETKPPNNHIVSSQAKENTKTFYTLSAHFHMNKK